MMICYVPEMAINLFSVFAVIKEGNYVLFDDDNVRIFSKATQEAVWLRRLFRDIGANVSRPMCLNEDNLGALNLAKNSSFHARTKHIDIRFHFIRSMVDNKEIEINYCSTKEMIADVLTKGLDRTSFQKFRQAMGIKIPHLNS